MISGKELVVILRNDFSSRVRGGRVGGKVRGGREGGRVGGKVRGGREGGRVRKLR